MRDLFSIAYSVKCLAPFAHHVVVVVDVVVVVIDVVDVRLTVDDCFLN